MNIWLRPRCFGTLTPDDDTIFLAEQDLSWNLDFLWIRKIKFIDSLNTKYNKYYSIFSFCQNLLFGVVF